jgi:hypothetical protein
MTLAVGTSSCSSSSRFGPTSTFNEVTPVRLPSGRRRLATSPSWTGSPPVKKTIGIVTVSLELVRVLPDLALVTAPEFLPATRIMAEPLAQTGAGRNFLHPFIDRRIGFFHPTRP